MRHLVGYGSDQTIGSIDDLPPLKRGCLIRFGGTVYEVIDFSTNRAVTEIYVEKAHPGASPDYDFDVEQVA